MINENKSKINYTVHPDINFIVDEKGSSFIALRKVDWHQGNGFRLEVRKWHLSAEGEERASKGFAFLTEEGPNELAKALVQLGYGDTDTLRSMLDARPEKQEENEIFYDPMSCIAGIVE